MILKEQIFVFALILLFSCNTAAPIEEREILSCRDFQCKSLIYEIRMVVNNYKIFRSKVNYSEKEVIGYCLRTDIRCGGYLYYSLVDLLNSSPGTYSILKEKYRLGNIDEFVTYMSDPTTSFEKKGTDIANELMEICNCK